MKTSFHTYSEIMQQPLMWRKTFESVFEHRAEIKAFLDKYEGYDIIFTGAGTSAFIGDVLEVAVAGTRLRGARAIATTDLITNPRAWLSPEKKVLLVSFARSGNSPESLGTIQIANSICRHIAHIYITCNAEGSLARTAGADNTLLLLLPPETNDRSLAMTSSFSSMTLAGMLLGNIDHIESERPVVEALARDAQVTLSEYDGEIENIAALDFDRAVFLGSGELKGIAEESRLKLQELTDGRIVCNFDSFLGFRHGPKAVINPRTVLVYLLSGDEHILRYETDLIKQINSNNSLVAQVAVAGGAVALPGVKFDLTVALGESPAHKSIYACLSYVLFAQLFGFYKSRALGLNPDSPSPSGNISRVVEGVTIYK